MSTPRPEIADLLEVGIPPGGKVITASDLHLPPARTDVSGRSCEMLARHLAAESGAALTVVLLWVFRRSFWQRNQSCSGT